MVFHYYGALNGVGNLIFYLNESCIFVADATHFILL
jgi:hypothetical protein